MKVFLLSTALFLSVGVLAQITFEPGYYIDQKGNRVEGLIKNMDWQSNPNQIEFKSSSASSAATLRIHQIQEFGITNYSKYVRFNVKMDRTSKDVNKIDENPDPVFNDEVLLLRVLLEGQPNLYEYVDGNLIRYFIKMENEDIEQLVYKKYKNSDGAVVDNRNFLNQLWRNLYCVGISESDLNRVSYTRRSLLKFFNKSATCRNLTLTNYVEKSESDRKQYRLTIRPGITYTSLSGGNPDLGLNFIKEHEYESKVGFRIGLENEYIFAFNKNKWSLLLEPTYQSYSTEEERNGETASVDYSSIEIPVGLRYYMYLNETNRVFVNVLLAFDVALNKEFNYFHDFDYEIKSGPWVALGAGYSVNGKYDIEVRYNLNRNLLSEFLVWDTSYNSFVLTLGYSIF